MRALILLACCIGSTLTAAAWDAHGHRTITYLALDALPADAPAWLRDAQVRHRVAWQSSEPDRWRGWQSRTLTHINSPDHYLDVELLEQFGLTLDTAPPLRNEYLRAMAVAKHEHPEQVEPYDASADPDRSKEWPGFLAHAICEHYTRLQACFMQVRVLEALNDPNRAFQLDQARANAIYHMGMLSHFVGDAAQPLHTTRHFNGWVGDNPDGFTTDRRFHSYIDGGVLKLHKLDYAAVRPLVKLTSDLSRRDPWKNVLEYLRRSHGRMRPLYELEKSGALREQPGSEFIRECLADGAGMLGSLYWSAWAGSVPNEKQSADFVFFDDFDPGALPAPPKMQPTLPAASAPTGPSEDQP